MIRMALALIFTTGGLLVGSLWLAEREEQPRESEPPAQAEVRTFDLGGLAWAPQVFSESSQLPETAEPADRSQEQPSASPPPLVEANPVESEWSDESAAPTAEPLGEPAVPSETIALAAADQDAWAALIRRMLDVYRRTGASSR